jgi:hypothetical protein
VDPSSPFNSDSLLDSNGVAEFPEKLFANQINQAIISTTEAFEKYVNHLFKLCCGLMFVNSNKFKDAVKEGFYQLMSYRDNYRSFCESSGRSMNKGLDSLLYPNVGDVDKALYVLI